MPANHGTPQRGLDAAQSALFQGRFGRMFRNLPAAQFGATEAANNANLKALADAMSAGFDKPKDGPDAEESGIPALYTYLGQFIDHDITFDPVSTLTAMADPDGLTDFRNPGLNLDNLYGRGPGDQPYMYAADGMHLATGEPLAGGSPDATDLPRFRGRALIGDPRNDENSIVSQFQGLMIRFHNRMVDENPGLTLAEIQQLVRFHYQYVILHDFLPRIIAKPVLDELKPNGHFAHSALRYFHWREDPFMPVEFAAAAYRLGHSMIRPGYRLNDDDATVLPVFPVPHKTGPASLVGFKPMDAGHGIDWARFIDIEIRNYGVKDADDNADNKRRLQFAYRLDTALTTPLAKLPNTVASDPPPSLGERNLKRAWRLGLPSGQAVARAMGLKPLADSEIMIAKAVDTADADPNDLAMPILDAVADKKGDAQVFAGNCPLWTYVLAEAAHHRIKVDIPVAGARHQVTTPQLGPVGGRIVAEVFLGLLFGDGASMLSLYPAWKPATPDYKLKDMVLFALGGGGPPGGQPETASPVHLTTLPAKVPAADETVAESPAHAPAEPAV